MTGYSRCGTCGALGAPWSRGHAPHCEKYRAPRSARLCPVCGVPVAVAAVVDGPPIEVTFACRRCDGITWTESTAPDPDDERTDDADDCH